MTYFKTEDSIVIQVQPYFEVGFEKAEENVVCGMVYKDGVFTTPVIEKTIQEKINELEKSVTKRNYREFVMGNQYSIDKINQVDADIVILRAKL